MKSLNDSLKYSMFKATRQANEKLKGPFEVFDVQGYYNLIGVFDELMDWKGGIVRLNDGFRHLEEGMTEKVAMILSGYSSRNLEIKRVPIPEPVPKPREWAT